MTNSKGIGIAVGFSLRLVRISVPYYPPAIVSFNPQGCAPVSRCAPHRCRSRAASASTGTALSAPATSANASWRTRAASASCARLTRRFGRGDAPVLAAPLPHAVTRRRARPCNWPAATPAWRWLRRPRSWTRWRCRSSARRSASSTRPPVESGVKSHSSGGKEPLRGDHRTLRWPTAARGGRCWSFSQRPSAARPASVTTSPERR